MTQPPDRPPLLQPEPHSPGSGETPAAFAPPAPPAPKRSRFRRPSRRVLQFGALGLVIVILVVAFGVQTWRLNARTTADSTATTAPPTPSRPGSTVTPTTTPGTTRPPVSTPNGQVPDVAGLECIADLIGKPPSARISKQSLAAQISAIAGWDEAERELRFTQVPDPSVLTPEEVADRVRRDVDTEYPPDLAALDSRLLSTLGAVPVGYDMRAALSGLLGEQVAGFYDPYTKQLVVASPDGRRPLDPVGMVTMAHELEHALVDQALGLPSLEVPETPTGLDDTDRALSRRSLVEGDATLVTNRFIFSALTQREQLDMLQNPAVNGQGGAVANVPNYLRSELTFPYEAGLDFACAIKLTGGWEALNGAYSQPPSTSAQILFPERFAAREAPADAPDPGQLGGTWLRERAQTLGAAELLWLFQAPGDNPAVALPDPKAAVSAWGGGELVQWGEGDRTALGISLVERRAGGGGADTVAVRGPRTPMQVPAPTPGASLCDSVRDWYAAAFPQSRDGGVTGDEVRAWDGDRQDAVLRCANGNVRLGIGPDLATARALAA